MKSAPPLPDRSPYKTKIVALPRKGYVFLDGASSDSIRAIASRVGAALGRKFTTQRADDGVHVWRVA